MSGARPVDPPFRCVVGVGRRFGTHNGTPIFPIFVFNYHCYRRPGRIAVPHTADKSDFVTFDLHPTTATVTFLPALQLNVDRLGAERQIAGQPLDDRRQLRAVRFPCR